MARKFFLALFLLVPVLLLSGCATTAKYAQMLHTWKGQDINALVQVWGYPDRTMKAPDGNKVYVYERRNVTHFPRYTVGGYTQVSTDKSGKTTVVQTPTYVAGGQTYYFNCTTWFEVDKNKKIVNISFRGNNCVQD